MAGLFYKMAIPLFVLFLNVYYYNYVLMCISSCGCVYVFAVPVGARGPGHGVTGRCSRSLMILNIFFREVCVKITLARHDNSRL